MKGCHLEVLSALLLNLSNELHPFGCVTKIGRTVTYLRRIYTTGHRDEYKKIELKTAADK